MTPLGALLPGDTYLAIGGPKRLQLWAEGARTRLPLDCAHGPPTCVVADGRGGVLITGHDHGEIVVWHDLPAWVQGQTQGQDKDTQGQGRKGSGGKPPATTTLHWHAHAVRALALSPDGRYLMSGGEVGVSRPPSVSTGLAPSRAQFQAHQPPSPPFSCLQEGVLVVWQLATGYKVCLNQL